MLKWKVGTQQEAIVKERIRLEKEVYERTVLGKYNGFIANWVPKWLSQSDEDHLKTDSCKKECKNCGLQVSKWIETEFSFCNEYSCGIVFCEKCAKNLSKELKTKLKG